MPFQTASTACSDSHMLEHEKSDLGFCGGARSRLVRWSSPLICVVAIVLALVTCASMMRSHEEDVAVGTASGVQEAGRAEASAEMRGDEDSTADALDAAGQDDVHEDEGEGDDADARDGALGHADTLGSDVPGGEGDASEVIAARELDKLAREAAETGEDVEDPSIEFSIQADLVDAASGVVRAYRAEATAQLLSSGYLDLKGNAWGAIVRDGKGWVDIVVAQASADDAETTVRIARLLVQEDEREKEE